MPDGIFTLLKSYYSCRDREEAYSWTNRVIDRIIDTASPFETWMSQRTMCPLCGNGGSGVGGDGYAFPEGLRRHLVGFGNTWQCTVMKVALALAHEHWNDSFKATEEAERVRKHQERQQRRRVETLFLVDPYSEPALRDEYSWNTPRSEEELSWAEERLKGLGFSATDDGNVRSYVVESDGYAVYADPREKGKIVFTVVKLPLVRKGRQARWRNTECFHILDGWKNDLRGKFDARLSVALDRLKIR